jgi:hypothetical protein
MVCVCMCLIDAKLVSAGGQTKKKAEVEDPIMAALKVDAPKGTDKAAKLLAAAAEKKKKDSEAAKASSTGNGVKRAATTSISTSVSGDSATKKAKFEFNFAAAANALSSTSSNNNNDLPISFNFGVPSSLSSSSSSNSSSSIPMNHKPMSSLTSIVNPAGGTRVDSAVASSSAFDWLIWPYVANDWYMRVHEKTAFHIDRKPKASSSSAAVSSNNASYHNLWSRSDFDKFLAARKRVTIPDDIDVVSAKEGKKATTDQRVISSLLRP